MQIIVAFPKLQDAKNIMNAISKQGFEVVLATDHVTDHAMISCLIMH